MKKEEAPHREKLGIMVEGGKGHWPSIGLKI